MSKIAFHKSRRVGRKRVPMCGISGGTVLTRRWAKVTCQGCRNAFRRNLAQKSAGRLTRAAE